MASPGFNHHRDRKLTRSRTRGQCPFPITLHGAASERHVHFHYELLRHHSGHRDKLRAPPRVNPGQTPPVKWSRHELDLFGPLVAPFTGLWSPIPRFEPENSTPTRNRTRRYSLPIHVFTTSPNIFGSKIQTERLEVSNRMITLEEKFLIDTSGII